MKENTTVEKLLEECDKYAELHPMYRWGQAVFNYIDEKYGVARNVQFIDNIDCFYDNSNVIPFVTKSVERINND